MSNVDLQRRRKREFKSQLFSTISKRLWPLALLLFHNLREISAQKLFVRDIFKLKSILEDYHYYFFFIFTLKSNRRLRLMSHFAAQALYRLLSPMGNLSPDSASVRSYHLAITTKVNLVVINIINNKSMNWRFL